LGCKFACVIQLSCTSLHALQNKFNLFFQTHCKHTAIHCNTLQRRKAVSAQECMQARPLCPATHCNTLQHTATHCNTRKRSPLKHLCKQDSYALTHTEYTATHCNTRDYSPLKHPSQRDSYALAHQLDGWIDPLMILRRDAVCVWRSELQ